MGLDLSLYNRETGEEEYEINWSRNPYGLIRWAQDNVGDKVMVPGIRHDDPLWYVCNHWNYGKSYRVNRELFKRVIDAYWVEIQKLDSGRFYFSAGELWQFIISGGVADVFHWHGWPEHKEDGRIGLDMERFLDPRFHLSDTGKESMLNHYKYWFKRLVAFAEALQDKRYRFYCSN